MSRFFRSISILFLVFVGVTYAQTAKVIQLTPAEAEEAKSLHEQQAAIAVKMEALRTRIAVAHLSAGDPHGEEFFYRTGWSRDFEYSEDFKFIVPHIPPYVPLANGCFNGLYSCGTLTDPCTNAMTPAVGTIFGEGTITSGPLVEVH